MKFPKQLFVLLLSTFIQGPFFTLEIKSSLRPMGKPISSSHTWTYINMTTAWSRVSLFGKDLFPSLTLSCIDLTQLHKTMGFPGASFYCLSGSTEHSVSLSFQACSGREESTTFDHEFSTLHSFDPHRAYFLWNKPEAQGTKEYFSFWRLKPNEIHL